MIEISYLNIEEPHFAKKFELFCHLVAPLCGCKEGEELSISLTNDETMKQLNTTYRGKDQSTDVLTFAFNDNLEETAWPMGEEGILGQIVISLNTLQINADYFKVSAEEELKRLVIHGLLHLLGEDHLTNNEDEPMLKKQELLLKQCSHYKIGV